MKVFGLITNIADTTACPGDPRYYSEEVQAIHSDCSGKVELSKDSKSEVFAVKNYYHDYFKG